MGFKLGWIATRTRKPEVLFEALDLEATGDEQEHPTAPFAATTLPMGWVVIVVNDEHARETTTEMAKHLSDHEVIQVHVEEDARLSLAARHVEGLCTWQVAHDGQQGEDHLFVEGRQPIELAGIRAWHEHDLRSNPEKESLFDVPIDLAKRLVGYRHDEDLPGLKKAHWQVLRRRERAVAPAVVRTPPMPSPAAPPPPARAVEPTPPEPALPAAARPAKTPASAWQQVRALARLDERRARHAQRREARESRRRPRKGATPQPSRRRSRRHHARENRTFWERLLTAVSDFFAWVGSELGNTHEDSWSDLEAKRKRLLSDSRARRRARREARRRDQRP